MKKKKNEIKEQKYTIAQTNGRAKVSEGYLANNSGNRWKRECIQPVNLTLTHERVCHPAGGPGICSLCVLL